MASSRSNKLSKLKALRHGEDHDYNYIHTFDTINKENNRISENKFPYEDGHNFEGFSVDSDLDFEGFDSNEDINLKEYTDRFFNMLQNLEEEGHLELNNEDNMDNLSQDELILNILDLIPKPLEDDDLDKAVEADDVYYFVVEKGSRNGNDMITDTWGYNYSYWRETGGKEKTKHFRCIKRHYKGKSDCPSY